MAGRTLALNVAAAVSMAAVLRSVVHGRRPSVAATIGTTAGGLYLAAGRPWMRTWGATKAETETVLPGDEFKRLELIGERLRSRLG
jgi:hypothetical protein